MLMPRIDLGAGTMTNRLSARRAAVFLLGACALAWLLLAAAIDILWVHWLF